MSAAVQQQHQSNSNNNNNAQFNFFKMCIGRPVVVKLNNGVEYRGMNEQPKSSNEKQK
ncbi:LSM domain-containing protein [Heterostelium album PN500]|uniref:LSM domain-containing protein n=1 Tax=Heterostelium pallidum (strain ATCC 26659 / Pp 5 / PN500) TaxID=670386 RepID=D3B4Q5_HETP5|nr:LSM domain-containing protein [Heterostelium album PN500]EFA84303.1 LSM domain-containing protein [Heterostelium album PN500]|eukprot:XP_020436419.1 LSM domain-containing protein [Heterostelium album PN500]